MSPRCGRAKVQISSLFFLHLRHESNLHHLWKSFARVGNCRHISSLASDHTLSASIGCTLFPRLAPALPVATGPQTIRALHPQLPRTQSPAATCQNSFRQPDMDYPTLLYPVHSTRLDAQSVPAIISHCHQLAYSVI